MLTRISLIIAILAGLAVGGLNFVKVKEKVVTLKSDLDRETKAHVEFEGKFKKTSAELTATNAVLNQTKTELAATKEERDTANAKAKKESDRAEKLNDDLKKTTEERNDAQQGLAAYKATGMTPEQITVVNKQLKSLQENLVVSETENKTLAQKIKNLNNELAIYKSPDVPVTLPAALKGKVLVADPKWNFVVLNVGENQGVLAHGELLVNRNGRLVAKVKVSSVQKDRCVANVMPGWQLGDVFEGDLVIPAYPAS